MFEDRWVVPTKFTESKIFTHGPDRLSGPHVSSKVQNELEGILMSLSCLKMILMQRFTQISLLGLISFMIRVIPIKIGIFWCQISSEVAFTKVICHHFKQARSSYPPSGVFESSHPTSWLEICLYFLVFDYGFHYVPSACTITVSYVHGDTGSSLKSMPRHYVKQLFTICKAW